MSPSSSLHLPERNFGLDSLRTAAIVAVLLFHGYLGFLVSTGLSPWQGWRAALSASAGIFALEWFFVLSGFLIGSILIRGSQRESSWWRASRDFWLRRWFRTVPNYWLFLGVNSILVAWGIEEGRFSTRFVLFLQSFAGAQEKPFFYSESWSLAVEEWFYLLFPLLLGTVAWAMAVLRGRAEADADTLRRRFWMAIVLTLVASIVLRTAMVPSAHFFDWDEHVRRVTVRHLDSIAWGVLAAQVHHWYPAAWARRRGLKALAGLVLMLFSVACLFYFMIVDWRGFAGGRFNDLALMTAPAVGTVLVLPWMAAWRAPGAGLKWLVERIATYSYSMYLCHFPLMLVMLHGLHLLGLDAGDWVGWLASLWVLLVFGLSALVFHGFEKPVTDLRDRFTRRVPVGVQVPSPHP